jgi:ligand-binding sensor domain-containing protein
MKRPILTLAAILGFIGLSLSACEQASLTATTSEGPFTMMVATDGGFVLSQDSAQTFQWFTTAQGLSNDSVFGAAKGSDGRFYIGTSNGLSILSADLTTFEIKRTSDGLASALVFAVAAVPGKILLCQSNGLSIYTIATDSFENKDSSDGLGADRCGSIAVNGQNVAIGTASGLTFSANGGDTLINRTTTEGLPSNEIMDVVYTNGLFMTSTDDGIAYTTNNGASFSTYDGFGLGRYFGLTQFADKIFAGGTSGVRISDDGGASYINRNNTNGLPENYVTALNNENGVLYVGTVGGGMAISTDEGESYTASTDIPTGYEARMIKIVR